MSSNCEPVIYVIDRNKSYRKIVVGCLSALNLDNIKEFNNGEACYTGNFPEADLIILDYDFGEGSWNGIEFMEEYKRLNKSSKFLFLSSNTGVEIAVESIRKGALDYIIKSKQGLNRMAKKVESGLQLQIRNVHEKVCR